MAQTTTITPCLLFNGEAAMKFYCSIFKDAKILKTLRQDKYGVSGKSRPTSSSTPSPARTRRSRTAFSTP